MGDAARNAFVGSFSADVAAEAFLSSEPNAPPTAALPF